MSTRGDYHPSAPRLERQTGVTDNQGRVTFAWPASAFAAPPVVAVGIQGDSAFRSHSITANSPSATTVTVLEAAGVTLLGIGVLAAGAPAAGVTVHATATAA